MSNSPVTVRVAKITIAGTAAATVVAAIVTVVGSSSTHAHNYGGVQNTGSGGIEIHGPSEEVAAGVKELKEQEAERQRRENEREEERRRAEAELKKIEHERKAAEAREKVEREREEAANRWHDLVAELVDGWQGATDIAIINLSSAVESGVRGGKSPAETMQILKVTLDNVQLAFDEFEDILSDCGVPIYDHPIQQVMLDHYSEVEEYTVKDDPTMNDVYYVQSKMTSLTANFMLGIKNAVHTEHSRRLQAASLR